MRIEYSISPLYLPPPLQLVYYYNPRPPSRGLISIESEISTWKDQCQIDVGKVDWDLPFLEKIYLSKKNRFFLWKHALKEPPVALFHLNKNKPQRVPFSQTSKVFFNFNSVSISSKETTKAFCLPYSILHWIFSSLRWVNLTRSEEEREGGFFPGGFRNPEYFTKSRAWSQLLQAK